MSDSLPCLGSLGIAALLALCVAGCQSPPVDRLSPPMPERQMAKDGLVQVGDVLEIKITDKLSSKSLTRDVKFSVAGS